MQNYELHLDYFNSTFQSQFASSSNLKKITKNKGRNKKPWSSGLIIEKGLLALLHLQQVSFARKLRNIYLFV